MHMLRHDLKHNQADSMSVGSLSNAGRDKIPVLLLSHHFVPVFRAPLDVPCALSDAMASAKQILHIITFLF